MRTLVAALLSICVSLPSLAQSVPSSKHVWIVAEQSHSYEEAVASMRYLMSLAKSYGYAQQYYSDAHPSSAALMHLTAGASVTADQASSSHFDGDNLARELLLNGLSWHSYQESLPYAGAQVLSAYAYVKSHDPMSYFTDTDAPSQWGNEVPFSQLAADTANRISYNFNYVTPNLLNGGHNGTLQQADEWLHRQLPLILARPEFQSGGDGLMFIVFDESSPTAPDNRCSAAISAGCGGRVLAVVVGPQVKKGTVSRVWHNHESLLKTVCLALGISSYPGTAQAAQPLSEFFSASAPKMSLTSASSSTLSGVPIVNLSAPAGATSLASPVAVAASATDSAHSVTGWAIYVDKVKAFSTLGPTSSISQSVSMAAGSHALLVRAWDSSGAHGDASAMVNVAGPSAAPVVTVSSPAANATVGSSLLIAASATDSARSVTGWAAYLDGATVYSTPGPTNQISTSVPLTSGTHTLLVRAWDSAGYNGSSKVTVTSAAAGSGRAYYVSTSGNDSNPGSASQPWRTISHAAAAAGAGATVHVAPGTYNESVLSATSGASSSRIRFISDQRWAAHVVGGGGEAVWQNKGDYVDIVGFDVTGSSPNGIENLGSNVMTMGNRVHDIVASCDSNGGSGINDANYSAQSNDLIANYVFNVRAASSCSSRHGVGIYHSNAGGHVSNNISFGNGTVGIQLWHAATNVVVANNTVFKNAVNGIVVGAGDSPGGVTNDYSTVVNNLVVNNGYYGIQEFGTTGPHNRYLNNLVYGNPSGNITLLTGAVSATLQLNAQFVNYTGDSSGDYRLATGSPGVDGGTSQAAPSADFDGGARPIGVANDIGAYEKGASPPAWPWP